MVFGRRLFRRSESERVDAAPSRSTAESRPQRHSESSESPSPNRDRSPDPPSPDADPVRRPTEPLPNALMDELTKAVNRVVIDPLQNKTNVIQWENGRLFGRITTPEGVFTFTSEPVASSPGRNLPTWTIHAKDNAGFDMKIGSVWLKVTRNQDDYLFFMLEVYDYSKNYCAFQSKPGSSLYNISPWKKSGSGY